MATRGRGVGKGEVEVPGGGPGAQGGLSGPGAEFPAGGRGSSGGGGRGYTCTELLVALSLGTSGLQCPVLKFFFSWVLQECNLQFPTLNFIFFYF